MIDRLPPRLAAAALAAALARGPSRPAPSDNA